MWWRVDGRGLRRQKKRPSKKKRGGEEEVSLDQSEKETKKTKVVKVQKGVASRVRALI